jgi:hypothetical protein
VGTLSLEKLTRSVVAKAASDEVPLLDLYFADYQENPRRALRPKPVGEAPTGFGGDMIGAVVPCVISIGGFLLPIIAQSASDAGVEKAKRTGLRWWRRRRRHPELTEEMHVPELSSEQLRLVRATAVEKARIYGLDERSASLIADAVVGALCTPPSPERADDE